MTLLDANVLLYSYNRSLPQHRAVAQWLEAAITGGEPIGLPLPTIWAFVRIATNHRLWAAPLTSAQAFEIVRKLCSYPNVSIVQPGPRHLSIVERLVQEFDAAGPLFSDAVLAAIALEYGGRIASTDQDFRRFPSVRWINPELASA